MVDKDFCMNCKEELVRQYITCSLCKQFMHWTCTGLDKYVITNIIRKHLDRNCI